MYTVSKGPSKIVAKSRRGVTQNYEKFETIKESSKKSLDYYSPEKISTPRPVFQTTKKSQLHTKQQEEERISPQHEELVKFISDSWNNIVVAQNPYDAATEAAAVNCTTPATATATSKLTNGHASALSDTNNNCSNYIEKSVGVTTNPTASLTAATFAAYTNGTSTNGTIATAAASAAAVTQNGHANSDSSSTCSSLSSISAVSSICTSPATSPQPQSPPVLMQATSAGIYCIEPPSPVLKDFKPFDLEAWWGRRLFNNITKTI